MTTFPTSPADRQIPAWIPIVGNGWAALLNQLHEDLRVLDAEYRIERFGTSLGSLRVTVADRLQDGQFDGEFADRATALTDTVETTSERICDTCRTLPIQRTASVDSTEINHPGASRP
ncbi:hypothetical protein AB0L47_34095 [Streptomyces bobili]|uniref:hypothetical protein n=1 Tax=Streptomyces bobili TaxID=67280 RepID=UPI00342D8CF6